MPRKHESSERPNTDGSTHHTKHSYSPAGENESPNVRRSHDRDEGGSKTSDHTTDQTSDKTYYSSDSAHGDRSEGDKTDGKGNSLPADESFADWDERHK